MHLKGTKTHRTRTFTILNNDNLNYTGFIKKYINLKSKLKRSFCSTVPANLPMCHLSGINTFAQIFRNIAKYLNIPNANLFTGHSFQRTSGTTLADSSAYI